MPREEEIRELIRSTRQLVESYFANAHEGIAPLKRGMISHLDDAEMCLDTPSERSSLWIEMANMFLGLVLSEFSQMSELINQYGGPSSARTFNDGDRRPG